MQPSDRIRGILAGGASGWEIVHRARKMIADGEKIAMLTVGEHERPTPAPILAEMDRSARAGNTRYSWIAGAPPLREAIAARMTARTGAPTGPENILVTAGGQSALFHAFEAVLDPGDACVILDPSYTTYPGTIRAAGGEVRRAPADPDKGFQPDLAALDAACAGDGKPAKALLINSPSNPTGAVYDRAHMEAIAEICRRHDLWLVSDEVYDGMIWQGEHISPRGLPGMAERTVVIGSLSKSHAMTGTRLGWLTAPAELAGLAADLTLNATYGLPGFIQDAGLFALTSPEGAAIEAEMVATFRRRRDLAVETLKGRQALRLSPPQGAMYVMLDLRATGLSGRDFADRLLDEAKIAVMPGESFGEAAAGHVRVALTVPDEALADALTRLADVAEALAR